MSNTTRLFTIGVAGLLALSVLAGAGAVATTGELSASQADEPTATIGASPNTTDATATHTTTVTVGPDAAGSSWNSLVLEYEASDVSNVGQEDVVTIGIDRGDDDSGTTVDENVDDDVSSVSASDDGETLTVGLGGNYDLEAGDELVLQFDDATNPSQAGNYTVETTVNQQSAAQTTDATLAIEERDEEGDEDDETDCPEATDE